MSSRKTTSHSSRRAAKSAKRAKRAKSAANHGRVAGASPKAKRRPPARPKGPRKKLPRMRLADAFRVKKRDEHYIANCYIFAIGSLKSKESEIREPRLKLLLEYLKEAARILEPPRTAAFGGLGADSPPVQMTVVHNVNRPVRNGQAQVGAEGYAAADQEAANFDAPGANYAADAAVYSTPAGVADEYSPPGADEYSAPSGAMPAYTTKPEGAPARTHDPWQIPNAAPRV